MTYAERGSPGGKPKIAKKPAVRPRRKVGDGRLAGAGDVKLVFFGSGPVAAATLRFLDEHFEIEAVITKPRQPHHRGEVPVLDFLATKDIPHYTASNSSEVSVLLAEKPFKSPLGVVVDFGIILSEEVNKAFPKGLLNSHFSLLPQWRGADPISFAILSGQAETGVSLMLIVEKLDEGPLLSQEKVFIGPDITTPELTKQLTELSNKLLLRDIPKYLEAKLQPYPQPAGVPTYSRKLSKNDGVIDWQKPARQLEREVRAYQGWPKSRSNLFGHDVIITKARLANNQTDGELVMSAKPGWLEIQELIAPSGRTMSGADFLRGYHR